MTGVERQLRAELGGLPAHVRSSALAEVALDLARRLDAEPGDDAAVRLSRELRMTVAALHGRAPETTVDFDAFLGRIAAPDLGHTAN